MSRRLAQTVYALGVVVTALSLLHAVAGGVGNFRDLRHRNAAVVLPFATKLGTAIVTTMPDGTKRAGLRPGDVVVALNGTSFDGYARLIAWTHVAHPGDTLAVTVIRSDASVTGRSETISVPAVGYGVKPAWAYVIQVVFFVVPFLALLTGLYVLFARPLSFQAWLVFFILAYCDSVFFPSQFMPRALVVWAEIWSDIVQTVMPIALLLFGIYFPDRAPLDRRFPWAKYVLIVPQLIFFPADLAIAFGSMYNLRIAAPFVSSHGVIAGVEQVCGMLSICGFFALLGYRMGTSTGDARRRIRILYYGATAGMTPLFVLLVLQMIRKTEFGDGVPRPLFIAAVGMLLLLPVSLAYVVVVQRAMELRILIRQGTKYFFAKQTLNGLRLVLACVWAYTLLKLLRNVGHENVPDAAAALGVGGALFLFRGVVSDRIQKRLDEKFFREAYSTEQVLSELSDEARSFTEVAPLLTTVSQRIAATLHIDRVAVFLRQGESYTLQYATGTAILMNGVQPLMLPANWTTMRSLAKEPEPSPVYRDDPSWLVRASQAEQKALNDLSAELLVPLPGRNRLLGVMMLGPKRSEEPYSRTDRQLLQSVASQTGLALENAELLENLTVEITQRERISNEIEIAREVQQRLFPQRYPVVPGLEMAGRCRPAQAVGGDYYDLFVTEEPGAAEAGRLALAVGDISGKGISASLLMASLRASLRSLARMETEVGQRDLTRLMRHVNQLVCESSADNRYATFFFAELDPETRMLTYVNAGHNPPMVLRGQETLSLPSTGLVVGLLEDATFEQETVQLQPGDVLLAYTDGISEAMNAAEQEWGEDRMLRAAKKLIGEPGCAWSAESLVECLFREADRFTAGAPQHDDMTVVVCAVR